jgi:deoxycytidylate deaminase
MHRSIRKLQTLMHFTNEMGKLSTCKRYTVGATVVPPDFSNVWSIGYNGPPMGQNNDSCRNTPGSCGCVHAEINALMKLSIHRGGIMLCGTCPCERCAGAIVNSWGMRHTVGAVVYCLPYQTKGVDTDGANDGLRVLATGGVMTARFDDLLSETYHDSYMKQIREHLGETRG